MAKMRLYGGREGEAEFRTMSFEEATLLLPGDSIWFIANDGSARRLKINGRVQRWKRALHRIRVPVKYGMYEYGELTERDFGANGRALVKI